MPYIPIQNSGGVRRRKYIPIGEDTKEEDGGRFQDFKLPFSFNAGKTQTTTPQAILHSQSLKTADIVKGKTLSPKAEQFRIGAEEAEKKADYPSIVPFRYAVGEELTGIRQAITRSAYSFLGTKYLQTKTVPSLSDEEKQRLSESQKFLFGDLSDTSYKGLLGETRKEEMRPIEERMLNFETKIRDYAKELLKSDSPTAHFFGKFLGDMSPALSFLAVGAVIGMDLTPFGGEKGVIMAIKDARTISDAISLLQKTGVDDDLIRFFARDVVNANTDKAAKSLFEHIVTAQTSTVRAATKASQPAVKPVGIFNEIRNNIRLFPDYGYEDVVSSFAEKEMGMSRKEVLDIFNRGGEDKDLFLSNVDAIFQEKVGMTAGEFMTKAEIEAREINILESSDFSKYGTEEAYQEAIKSGKSEYIPIDEIAIQKQKQAIKQSEAEFNFTKQEEDAINAALERVKQKNAAEGRSTIINKISDEPTAEDLIAIEKELTEELDSVTTAKAKDLEPLATKTGKEIVTPPLKETAGVPLIQSAEKEKVITELKTALTTIQKMIDRSIRPPSKMVTRRARQSTFVREQVKKLIEGARYGAVTTRTEIAQTQKELIDIIKDSGMELKDQAKFIDSLKRVRTSEQFRKAISDVERRISEILNATEVREIKADIKKELSETMVKADKTGVRVGKMTADAQREFDIIKTVSKLTQEEAREQLDNLLFTLEDGFNISDGTKDHLRLLKYQSGDVNVQEAQQILDDIRSIKETGKTYRQLQIQNAKAEVEGYQGAFTHSITGGRGLLPETGYVPNASIFDDTKLRHKPFKAVSSTEDYALMPTFLFDKTARYDASSMYMQSPQSMWWRKVFGLRNIQNKEMRAANKDIENTFSAIFNVEKGTHAYRSKAVDMMKIQEDLGVFHNKVTGKPFHLKATKNQLMKRWAEFQDETLIPTFDAMGWDKDIRDAVSNSLSLQEKEMATWFMNEFYPNVRKGRYGGFALDPIFERQTGTILGNIKNYTPIEREKYVSSVMQLLEDSIRRSSVNPSAIKARIRNMSPLSIETGLFDTAQKHLIEISHYKAFSEFVNQGRAIFKGADLQNALKQNFRDGATMINIINQLFDDLAKDGVASAQSWKTLDNMRGNAALAYVGLNPVAATKQYVGTLAWIGEMPSSAFAKGISNLAINPVEKTRFLYENSQMLITRFEQGAIERDIEQAMKRGNLDDFGEIRSHRKIFSALVRINDRVSIVAGGWGHYLHNLERLSGEKVPTNITSLQEFIKRFPEQHKQAISLMEEAALRTQQAANVENLSQLQRMGSAMNLFTLFQSAPVAQFGNTLSTLRAMGFFGDPKRIPTGQGLKRLSVYLVAIPAALQFISDGFEFKPRRQAAAIGASVASGGFTNYPVFIGETLLNTGRAAAGLPYWDVASPAPMSVLNEFGRGAYEHRKILDDISAEEVLDIMIDISMIVGTLNGIPMKPTERIFSGAFDVASGKGDIRQLVGYSKTALEPQGAEIQKSKSPLRKGGGSSPLRSKSSSPLR
jgi:hypothetical protein